jgi:hypothetical protein
MNRDKICAEGIALSHRINDDIKKTMKKLKLEEDEGRNFRNFTLATVICANIKAHCEVFNKNLDNAISDFIDLIHHILDLQVEDDGQSKDS